jgi:oligopeptide transport system substrate-binding protein
MKHPTTRWRGLIVLAGVLIVAGLLLGACGSSSGGGSSASPSAASSPKPGGTYNFGLGADPVAIDNIQAYENMGMQVVHQYAETLVALKLNDQGLLDPVPGLAESWDTTDAQTWTFHLKKGVMFQAPVSREVKAQDVVDSWNRATDKANASPTSYVLSPIEGCGDDGYATSKSGLSGVKAIDDYTVEVKLRYPFAEFIMTLVHPVSAIVPVDYVQQVGAKAFGLKPVGTGPYMVEMWQRKQYVDMVKNTAYWDTANAGYVDKIHFPVITSSQTMWLEFQKGSLDYTEIPPGQARAAEKNPKVTSGEWTAKAWPEISTGYIGFNMNDSVVGGTQGLELRKAMYMGSDVTSVINVALEGFGVPATGIVPEGIAGWRADVSPYKVNDDAGAKTALAAAGTVPKLQYWYNTDEGNQKVAEILQAGWKNMGVTVELSNFEWATFLDKVAKGGGQVYRQGWIADYPSMDNFLWPLFESHQSPYNNETHYKNPQFDALLNEARKTLDAQTRYDKYAEAEKLLLTDASIVPMYYYRSFRVTNNRIGGFIYDPMGFVNMWQIWVK